MGGVICSDAKKRKDTLVFSGVIYRKPIVTLNEKNKNIYLNIIYLVDLTLSMRKHKKLVQNINSINQSLKNEYPNIKFGYTFYRDYYESNDNEKHIEVIKPDAYNYNIPHTSFVCGKDDEINFIAGGDYAEDWANPLNEISKLNFDFKYENIIIHLCDAGAHGNRFSDYCLKNDEEKKLIEALNNCSTKNIKIIGLLFNEFNRKSFLECQNIYSDNKGYYNIVDLTRKNLETLDWNELIIQHIEKALKNELNINRFYYNKIENFEKEFDYIIKNKVDLKNIHLLNLNVIKSKYFQNDKTIQFLPDLDIKQIRDVLNSNSYYYSSLIELEDKIQKNIKYNDSIKQGSIGDCYLISTINSILLGNVPLIRYIFPCYYNTDENSDVIYMNVFEDGYRKIISFNNTYPIQVLENNNTKNYDLCFSKPLNNSFALICLEKGYAVFKSDKKEIKTGFVNIWGGWPKNVYRDLFGTNTEVIIKKYNNSYDLIKNKIKKYIDCRGIITFCVLFNISKSGHAFSVIGYKENKNTKELLIEILNPWHSGAYLKNNIKKQTEYNEFNDYEKKQLFDEEKMGKNIYENEFDKPELKESFDNYKKNGYLIMKYDTFYNWIYHTEFCDPMIGGQEYFIEILPKEQKNVSFDVKIKTKFKAFIIYNSGQLNEEEYKTEFSKKVKSSNSEYKLILKNNDNNNIYENDEKNDALIYEILDIGNYTLEIINKNLVQEEINYFYIKIQTISSLDINKFDLSNGGFGLINCAQHGLSINNNNNNNNQNFPPPGPASKNSICVCNLYKKYILIDEIMYYIIQIYNYFSINKTYDFTDILPVNDSDYKYYSSEYVKNPHLYYYYIETIKGFIVIIINKSKFNFDCNSIIEYNIEKYEYIAYFIFGSFKISYDLKIYDFDFKFKNILTSFKYNDSFLYLRECTIIIERLKSNKEEINRKIINYFEKLAINLEKSKINFINIEGSSCYQSSVLQGFIHIIFPIAIRNIISNIDQNKYKDIDNIDKLKNNNLFNDMIIDILKDINNLIEKGEGSTGYLADKLFKQFPPKKEFHEGLDNIFDVNLLHKNLLNNQNNISDLIDDKNYNEIKIINIKQDTIITDVMKIKIEGDLNCIGNIVLKFDENDIKDNDLNVIKLLKKCKQLYINDYSTKKIETVSDVIYMVIDRISGGQNITKDFNINEKIYFDNINKCFTEVEGYQYLVYELKFMVYHLSFGHFIAYCKIEDEWYCFNDLNGTFAIKENPFIKENHPIKVDNNNNNGLNILLNIMMNLKDQYPVALYYVKKK